jgi:hypothetical protein
VSLGDFEYAWTEWIQSGLIKRLEPLSIWEVPYPYKETPNSFVAGLFRIVMNSDSNSEYCLDADTFVPCLLCPNGI